MKRSLTKENLVDVAIIDDHAIFREALKIAFRYHGKINVDVEASSYSELLAGISISKTEIIIMDLNMPDLNSTIGTIEHILQIVPNAKILILTMHNDDFIKKELLKSGIYSFIHKGTDFDLLIESIMMAAGIIKEKIRSTGNGCVHNEKRSIRRDLKNVFFTEREKTILTLMAEGKTNLEISRIVFLSVRSIEQIRHNMKERANVTNTASLIDFAIRNHVIE